MGGKKITKNGLNKPMVIRKIAVFIGKKQTENTEALCGRGNHKETEEDIQDGLDECSCNSLEESEFQADEEGSQYKKGISMMMSGLNAITRGKCLFNYQYNVFIFEFQKYVT